MQVTQILKSKEKEKIYYEVILANEIFSFRWMSIVGMAFTAAFFAIDYWRAAHYQFIIIFRGIGFLSFAISTFITFRFVLSVRTYHWLCAGLASIQFTTAFLVDYFAVLPEFFLPNSFTLFAFGFNTTLGHPMRLKIYQTTFVTGAFILYARYFSPHHAEHLAQAWNFILTCALSCVIALLIERHRLYNFVHRTQLLESRRKNFELNKLKTKLISILSHDLASPLNSLVGLLHLKNENLLSEAELTEHSKKVTQSLSNLSSMLGNLVRWSKSQLEGFTPVLEKIDIRHLAAEMVHALSFQAAQKNIEVRNEVSKAVELVVDKEIMKIVLRNFLTNAIKFSHRDGVVVISSSVQNGSFTLSVKDNGMGMTHEQLEKLFVPGKNSSPGTQNETGSGIGLLITKDFVEMMGGSISVKSEVGKGSEFSMTMAGGNG
jgi:signal transduction histidine kinase